MTAPRIEIGTAPLAGTTLVEASAGTGKTWTIAALYVRLLLERRLPVEQVLVLTFGVAATAELKTRIRDRLVQVRDALAGGDAAAMAGSEDALLAHVGQGTADARRDAQWLALAVESFDQAPVFTLHGFCQRALAEHAFESGAPFVVELAPDESALVDEVAQDFWRRELAAAPAPWAWWLGTTGVTPAALARDIGALMQRPYAEVVGPENASLEPFLAFAEAHGTAQRLWRMHREALHALLQPVWKTNVTPRFRDMDACMAASLVLPGFKGPIVQFAPDKLGGKVRHPFLEAVAALFALAAPAAAALDGAYGAMRVRLAAYARAELTRRKRERALVGYNDLVVDLSNALRGPGGEALAATLRERYPAALLDEFQDTDPLQAEIFARMYPPGEGAVYCVGDPKQAIYGFRGADVHAYIAARARADAQRTLLVNRRSVTGQVEAVNAVFARARAFIDAEIGFAPSSPGPQSHAVLAVRDDLPAPFTLWFMTGSTDKPITKAEAGARTARATADAIARLLAPGAATLGGAPLQGRDIAVLVRTHVQGALVRRRLAERGIASVTYGQDSVYRTPEAAEVERVLLAIAEPGREALVRGALATDLLGADAAMLASYAQDARAWDAVTARFVRYRDDAVAQGFIRMWRELVEVEGVPARLLALPEGERRLTNLQHLSDLLQQAAARDGLDVEALARLLARARESRVGDMDAQVLRLESDEQLVRVLTVHTAKGLEFPVVFCPFLWDGATRAGDASIAACHEDGRAIIDMGSPRRDARRARADEEALAERVRLAYVALTRAKHRCIVTWGRIGDAGASALAWLLHGVTGAAFAPRSEAVLRGEVDALAAASAGAIAVTDLPSRAETDRTQSVSDARVALQARTFRGVVPAPWRVSSFSGLLARRALESPDHDALPAEPLGTAPRTSAPRLDSMLDFPGGVRPGTLVHALFERVDFAHAEAPAAREIVERTLVEYGMDLQWGPALQRMLCDVLATPLDASGLTLRTVASGQRMAELEFLFPVDAGAPHLVPGAATPRGFMKGYIDLVFTAGERWYVLDWKSNRLGAEPADYAPERLAEVMRDRYYDLQYRLYTVAVHRHLQARLQGYDYDRHFGGVFYLFVRGMRPESGPRTGVFFARPDRDDIVALSRRLSQGHAA